MRTNELTGPGTLQTVTRRVFVGLLLVATASSQWRLVSGIRAVREKPTAYGVGARAAPINAETLDGERLESDAFRGKTVVLAFWASWCVPCRFEMPEIAAVSRNWAKDRGDLHRPVFLAINVGEEPGVSRMFGARWSIGRDIEMCLDYDMSLAREWEVGILPTTIVIGGDGNVVARESGYKPELGRWLVAALERAEKQRTEPNHQ